MSVQFIGDCSWTAVDAPRWTLGSWGEDRATVPYCGRRDKKEQFLDTLTRFGPLKSFPGLRMVQASQSGGTISIPVVELAFIGFRKGHIPPAKGVDSSCVQSASGSGSYVHGGETFNVTGSFTYRAARTTWTWFETTTPAKAPRFATVQNAPASPLAPENIVSAQFTDDANGRLRNVPYAAFVAVFNSLVPAAIVSDYVREPLIPGALWGCSATVDWKVI